VADIERTIVKEGEMKEGATKEGPNARIGDDAVRAKTGKGWDEWFRLLDAAGARQLDHRAIVALVSERHGVGPWWRQMVAVTYEQARGLRAQHEKPEGFEISVSRTIGVPVDDAYTAWHDARRRARWLPEKGLVVRKATPGRSLRITWADGRSSLVVAFAARGKGRCQVAAQHGKLPDAKAAARMKAYWAEALERMRALLEK
jgi:uncharacterized protein YndB with AHSA1/START domain